MRLTSHYAFAWLRLNVKMIILIIKIHIHILIEIHHFSMACTLCDRCVCNTGGVSPKEDDFPGHHLDSTPIVFWLSFKRMSYFLSFDTRRVLPLRLKNKKRPFIIITTTVLLFMDVLQHQFLFSICSWLTDSQPNSFVIANVNRQDIPLLFFLWTKCFCFFLPFGSFYANIPLNESFVKHVAHFNIGHTEKWSFTCPNDCLHRIVSLLFAVNLLNSCAKQTHLTFIVHPAAVQSRIEGLMRHCHLHQITWLRIMHNYDKWLMMVLWSRISYASISV